MGSYFLREIYAFLYEGVNKMIIFISVLIAIVVMVAAFNGAVIASVKESEKYDVK